MSGSDATCAICGKHVPDREVTRCSICGKPMHKACARDDALMDSEENYLCPYDALLAALDWFDTVVATYVSTLDKDQRHDILNRLKFYTDLLTE